MKMLKLLKSGLFGLAMLLPLVSAGQGMRNLLGMNSGNSIDGIPLGVLPMQFNSSFAGESEGARLNSIFTYSGFYENRSMRKLGYHLSYDQFIPALYSGIGIAVNRRVERFPSDNGEYLAPSNSVSIALAPKFSVRGKYTLSPSIDFSYGQGSVREEIVPPRYPRPINYFDRFIGQHAWLESRLGLLLNTQKFYFGYTTYLLNRNYFENQPSTLPQRKFHSSVQGGYTFQRKEDSRFSFTPQAAYILGLNEGEGILWSQRYFHTIGLNLTFRYDTYIAGLNNTGYHLGWQSEKLRVMLSNQPFPAGEFSFFGNGNLSFRYIFKT